MKPCTKCNEEKPLSEFSKKNATRLSSWCKPCHNSYNKERYAADPEQKERLLITNRKRKAFLTDFVRRAKDFPCADCGGRFPSVCMDFDHLRDKKFTISQKKHGWGLKTLQAEMDKCDVVCANCHRIRTKERRLNNDRAIKDASKA
jgi:transcription elongation factor Elf1